MKYLMTLYYNRITINMLILSFQLNQPELNLMLKSNLIDLLIFCGTRIETYRSLSYHWKLTSELYSKQQQQQQLKSLQRLAGDIVRRNLWPNALYGISKLPLPVALQRFVCFLNVKIKVDRELMAPSN